MEKLQIIRCRNKEFMVVQYLILYWMLVHASSEHALGDELKKPRHTYVGQYLDLLLFTFWPNIKGIFLEDLTTLGNESIDWLW